MKTCITGLASAAAMGLLLVASVDCQADGTDRQEMTIVTKIRLKAERIEYVGLITAEANAAVFELYDTADPKPRSLLIESRGGGAAAAMQLGTWLMDHGLDVEVDTFCFSSCANYVFPAGRKKRLAERASLMWHGGATQPISMQELEQVLDYTLDGMDEEQKRTLLERHTRSELLQQLDASRLDLVAREAKFFEALGVDQRITVLGHLYEHELLAGQDDYPGWDFSIDDLDKLGVHGIEIKGGGPWRPAYTLQSQRIFRIDLDALPGFTPR